MQLWEDPELKARVMTGANRLADKDAKSALAGEESGALNRYTRDNAKDSIGDYVFPGNYEEVNSALRSGKGLDDLPKGDRLTQQIRAMDSAIEKSELDKPIVVHRNSSANLLGGLTDPKMIMEVFGGKVVQDPAFLSTSAAEKGSQIDGEILFQISVPAGKGRGAFIDPLSQYQGENEFLLKRSTKLVVMNAYKGPGGKTVVELQA